MNLDEAIDNFIGFLKDTDIYKEYRSALEELNKDPDAEEPCSWGSFYLHPEEWNPGYYDFVFLYKNKVFATMLTKFYKPDELLNKSDAELEKLMKQ